MPEIDMLHEELVVEVMKHLSHADRMTCATTSKRFAEALTHPVLLKDIWFTVRREGIETAAPVLMKSCRGYHNLRLTRARLNEFDLEFWTKVGKSLRRLALDLRQWTPHVLHDIFRKCSSLTHLSIQCDRAQDIIFEDFEACGTYIEDVRASLSNVRHLHFDTVSVDGLGHLLGLIPNVSSISLKVFGGEFLWETLINRTLADPRAVTELDLGWKSTSDADLNLIMRAFSGTLRELRLHCEHLTSRAGAAIAECSRLRRLSLNYFRELENTHMRTILRSNLGLEMLELRDCELLTDDGLSPIHELRKLRRVIIHGCNATTHEFWCRMGEILTLEGLDSSRSRLNWKFIESIACLKNLERLRLANYVQSHTSFRLICENLEKLQTLEPGICRNLSDADGLMLSRLRRLKTLSITDTFKFKDLTLEGVTWGSEMESLRVRNSSLTDLGLLSLVGQQGRLKDITLMDCNNITDQGLMTLLPRAPLLEKIDLSGCTSIGDEFIKALGDSCPRLYDVFVHACAISSRAVESFQKRRPTVRVRFLTSESD